MALAVLDAVESEGLEENVRVVGDHLRAGLEGIQQRHSDKIEAVRGLGFMVGAVLKDDVVAHRGDPALAPSGALVAALHERGMLTVPAGTNVVRFLPALNTGKADIDEALDILEEGVKSLSA